MKQNNNSTVTGGWRGVWGRPAKFLRTLVNTPMQRITGSKATKHNLNKDRGAPAGVVTTMDSMNVSGKEAIHPSHGNPKATASKDSRVATRAPRGELDCRVHNEMQGGVQRGVLLNRGNSREGNLHIAGYPDRSATAPAIPQIPAQLARKRTSLNLRQQFVASSQPTNLSGINPRLEPHTNHENDSSETRFTGVEQNSRAERSQKMTRSTENPHGLATSESEASTSADESQDGRIPSNNMLEVSTAEQPGQNDPRVQFYTARVSARLAACGMLRRQPEPFIGDTAYLERVCNRRRTKYLNAKFQSRKRNTLATIEEDGGPRIVYKTTITVVKKNGRIRSYARKIWCLLSGH